MVLIWGVSPELIAAIISFRPLAGIMVLITAYLNAEDVARGFVSVPLRGLWFLSQLQKGENIMTMLKFPSPCGDYGSYLERSLSQ